MTLINPWFLVGWLATLVGAFFYGVGHGQDQEIAGQAREQKFAQIATEAATAAAASAISRIEVKHTTIRQQLEKEIHEKPVYRDCRSGSDAVRLFNSSIEAGPTSSPGSGSLPAEDAAAR